MSPEALDLRRMGDRAVLVDLPDNAAVQRLAVTVAQTLDDELEDVVPGDRTLLLAWRDPDRPPPDLERRLSASVVAPNGSHQPRCVSIPVTYDGADLDHVAQLTGLAPKEVARRHAEREYRVAFVGFAPGFGYLTGGDRSLAVPRRDEPRTEVPAGSVALAGGYCAVYPRRSPGGWQLIGRTDAVLFDADRDPPSLLAPGTVVRFRPR